jgi:hypothetical protein
MYEVEKIKIKDFLKTYADKEVYLIKKKRERAIYYDGGKKIYFKVWVPAWTQSKIASFGLSSGFYNEKNVKSLSAILYDETGPRGYIQKKGESVIEEGDEKSWKKFKEMTSYEQQLNFILETFKNSIDKRCTYSDLAPSNIIIFEDQINFIDLESIRSFDLIYDGKRSEYENFELDAWWKPQETAKRDVNKYFKAYIEECLDLKIEHEIDSVENFHKTYRMLKEHADNRN